MDVMDAVNAVWGWLGSQHVAIAKWQAESLPDARFRIEFQQILPEQKQRIFDVVPTGVPDCWDVVEVQA